MLDLEVKRSARMAYYEELIKTSRVLIVDNDYASFTIMSKMLSTKGFKVSSTTIAEEALSMASDESTYSFRLVVVDFHLPGMVDFEFLHKLKRVLCASVAVITADKSDKTELDGLVNKYSNLCLVKPVQNEDMELLWRLALKKGLVTRFLRSERFNNGLLLNVQPPDLAADNNSKEFEITLEESGVDEESITWLDREFEEVNSYDLDNNHNSKRARIDDETKLTWNRKAELEEITRRMNVRGLAQKSVTTHWLYWKKFILPSERQQNEMRYLDVSNDIAEATWAPHLSSQLPNNFGGFEIMPNAELSEGSGENVASDKEDVVIYDNAFNAQMIIHEINVEQQNLVILAPPDEDVAAAAVAVTEVVEEEPFDGEMMLLDVKVVFRDEDLDGLF